MNYAMRWLHAVWFHEDWYKLSRYTKVSFRNLMSCNIDMPDGDYFVWMGSGAMIHSKVLKHRFSHSQFVKMLQTVRQTICVISKYQDK
jgi:hypothetical protein